MHLLAPLSAGIAQAPLGTAVLVLRDTATPADYYEDFEGAVPGSTGTPVALDSAGSAEVYVDALVDVSVYNASGVLVRQFTAGHADTNVEVRSASFTGNPYDGGAAGAGEPTTLQAVLDLWLTNAGEIDWKVDVNGTPYTISQALSSAALGIVFNVKSTLYAGGAIGDGATNDYAAVAATVAACAAAGGGIVWFPPGTYRLNSPLTVPDKVTIAGAGPGASNILIGHNTGAGIELLTGTVGQQVIGLRFSHNATTAQQLLRVTSTIANISSCEFNGQSTTAACLGTTSGAAFTMNVDNCRFYPASQRSAIDTSTVTAANTRANITRCYVRCNTTGSASNDLFKVYGGVYSACIIDFRALAGGNPRGIDGSNGGIVTGCRFLSADLGIVWYGIRCPEDGSGFTFTENANEFGQGTDPLNGHAYDFTTTEAILGSRDGRWIEITEALASGTATVLLKEFGRCEHYNSTAGAGGITVQADSVGPKHATADLLMSRNPGSTSTYTLSSTWFVDGTAYTFDGGSGANRRQWAARLYNPGTNMEQRWHIMDAISRGN